MFGYDGIFSNMYYIIADMVGDCILDTSKSRIDPGS